MMNERELYIQKLESQCKFSVSYYEKGGQHVGSPPPNVKVIHVPTGILAEVGYERSQIKNKRLALLMIEYALTDLNFNIWS